MNVGDDLDDLLGDLTEEELLALDAEFDPNDDLVVASERKAEIHKARGFEQKDVVQTLEQLIIQNKANSTPSPEKKSQSPKPKTTGSTIPWSQRNKMVSGNSESSNNATNNQTVNNNNNNIGENNNKNNIITKETSKASHKTITKKPKPLWKSYKSMDCKDESDAVKYIFGEDEDEVFGSLTEDEILELAAFTDTHSMLTQKQSHSYELKKSRLQRSMSNPVKGPGMRRMMSMAEDDADLDSSLLLDCLQNDSEEIFFVRVNNLALEKPLLLALFEALKTTKTMRHLSLAGIHLKDEDGLILNEAMKENTTIESLNLESNDLTNLCIEPLCEILETHPSVREFKCSHQKHGLGSRGEEAMARALSKNERLLKISYPFKVPSARSLADRCQIRNGEILRQKRTKGEDFYNYKEEIKKRDAHVQPWIRERTVDKNEQMKSDLLEQRGRMKSVPSMGRMRMEAKMRAKENAKPTMDNELADKLNAARKSRGRSFKNSTS